MTTHPWDQYRLKKYSPAPEPKREPSPPMSRNWYELSIIELENKKERMLNWLFITKQDDPNKGKMWKALTEVTDVLEIKREAEKDPFIQMVIEELCL